MIKFLYVTDLHGNEWCYRQVLKYCIEEKISIIANGGDMLPKNGNLYKVQKKFLLRFFRSYMEEVTDAGIRYYGMFGNDDLKARFHYWRDLLDEFENLYDLTEGWFELPGGYEITGMNMVPDYPFSLKDWCVRDDRDWKRPTQRGRGQLSTSHGFEKILDIDRFFAERPTMEELLSGISTPSAGWDNAVLVTHVPPADVGLACLYDGTDVGSKALNRWIAKTQPMLTLHGHIHESPDVSGKQWHQFGNGISHHPGQMECEVHNAVRFSVINVEDDKLTINIHALKEQGLERHIGEATFPRQ